MIKRALLAVVCGAVFAAGCMSTPGRTAKLPVFRNGSAVDLTLAARAAEQIWYAVQKLGCDRYDVITPSPIIRSEEFQFDSASSNVKSGMTVERWIASGCGRDFEFEVTFAADGRGGTDVGITYVKP